VSKVTHLDERRPREVKITPREQLECLMLAQMNQEKAKLCTPDQAALAAFFLVNAQVLMKVAGK
jgi:hypothetical protein